MNQLNKLFLVISLLLLLSGIDPLSAFEDPEPTTAIRWRGGLYVSEVKSVEFIDMSYNKVPLDYKATIFDEYLESFKLKIVVEVLPNGCNTHFLKLPIAIYTVKYEIEDVLYDKKCDCPYIKLKKDPIIEIDIGDVAKYYFSELCPGVPSREVTIFYSISLPTVDKEGSGKDRILSFVMPGENKHVDASYRKKGNKLYYIWGTIQTKKVLKIFINQREKIVKLLSIEDIDGEIIH